jgi:2-oxoglutarate dehydrogenase E2 component (dihydrolipoamide succinyltransferase)
MAVFELVMPKMGESVAEATIIKWVKNVGDVVDADDTLLEIATDKVDSEVPTPTGGKITKLLFNEGDVVEVGKVIAHIETEAGASVSAKNEAPAPAAAAPKVETVAKEAPGIQEVEAAHSAVKSSDSRFYSPLVKTIASTEGISQAELDGIQGTGQEGRVTKTDILNYVSSRNGSAPKAAPAPTAPAKVAETPKSAPSLVPSGGDEIIEMDRMRKLIADHMVMSKQTSPHVTSFVEADVTNIVLWRNKVKNEFEKKYKEKITFTPIFVEAVAKAIKDFPMINVQVNGTQIIKKANINVGMAAALPTGNLIVPVIKNADQLNLLGLTKVVNDLANRARLNKLSPDEIQGGTYTISNVGTFGNVLGTPIINQPQVAILAVGAIQKKPAVLETEMGDVIAIRHKMFLSHSYDHRVVDGALGGSFVKRVADYLEAWDINTSI